MNVRYDIPGLEGFTLVEHGDAEDVWITSDASDMALAIRASRLLRTGEEPRCGATTGLGTWQRESVVAADGTVGNADALVVSLCSASHPELAVTCLVYSPIALPRIDSRTAPYSELCRTVRVR